MSNMVLHKDGYIINGLHFKGLELYKKSLKAGLNYYKDQKKKGNIVILEEKWKSRQSYIRYKIKKEPQIIVGQENELALLRMQHYLRENEGKIISEEKLLDDFNSLYSDLIDFYKQG